MPEICHSPIVLTNANASEHLIKPCDSWKCPVCSRRKKRELEKKIKIACDGKTLRHLVLTLKDDEDLMTKWNSFKTQLQKRGKLKEYIWVKEFQERGVRHLHILIFEFIRYELVNRYWEGRTSIKFVRGNKNYITKYLGELDAQELFNPGEKRFSTSRGLFVPQKCSIPRPGYTYVRLSSESYIECTVQHFQDYYILKELYWDIVKDLSFD